MAVIPMWQVDRDQSMHTSKTEADKHDLMLEIGEYFAVAIKAAAPDVSAVQAETIGLFLSKNRDAVAKLCKGSHAALTEVMAGVNDADVPIDAAVTPIRAVQ